TLVANLRAHDAMGSPEGRVDVAPDPSRFIGDIRPKAVVHKSPAAIATSKGIGNHRERIELDHDSIGRVTRLLPRFRDDEADQVAAVAHPVAVEEGTVG